jgi:hypothetical protein
MPPVIQPVVQQPVVQQPVVQAAVQAAPAQAVVVAEPTPVVQAQPAGTTQIIMG